MDYTKVENRRYPWDTYRDKITTVVLEPSITGLSGYQFTNMQSLQTVQGSNLQWVGCFAFWKCTGLSTIPMQTVTSVDMFAFEYDAALTGNLSFPVLTGVDMHSFAHCPGITGFSAPQCTYIGSSAFLLDTSLKSVSFAPLVYQVGQGAFSDCSSLTAITLHQRVYDEESLRTGVFDGCTSLSSVTLTGFGSIERDAFKDCTSLRTLNIWINCKGIGDEFSGCTNLTAFTVDNDNLWFVEKDGALYNNMAVLQSDYNTSDTTVDERYTGNGGVYEWYYGTNGFDSLSNRIPYPTGTVLICCPPGKSGSFTVADGTLCVNENAFKNCSKLTSVLLPETLTHVDSHAFDGIMDIDYIVLPASVQYVDSGVFSDGLSNAPDYVSRYSLLYFKGDAPLSFTAEAWGKTRATASSDEGDWPLLGANVRDGGVIWYPAGSQAGVFTVSRSSGTVAPDPVPGTSTSDNVVSIDSAAGIAYVNDGVTGQNAAVPLEYIVEGKVYRMYDPARGEHFYTKNAGEMQTLVALGWQHFYTDAVAEVAFLVNAGWQYEGISFYAYANGAGKGSPQYRLYNPNSTNGEHNWTSNTAERDMLIAVGWQNEGAPWEIR